ncbi:MAG: acyl-CoA carboxylase subunit epsilon, partial [Pseudonocardia sp.]|nr:acyl-CoA carboxylase subunit epsilon [Pseudonocardia sp.]
MTGEAEGSPEERRSLFRVVRGEPSHAELAALTVVLAAAASAGGETAPAP